MSERRKTITPKMKVDALLHRVFLQFGVYLKCSISGEDMKPGDAIQFDHTHCVELGGPHVYQNLRPALVKPHQKKTAADLRMIKKTRPGHAEKFAVIAAKPLPFIITDAIFGDPKPKRKWPKGRKLQSRPFQKRKKAA